MKIRVDDSELDVLDEGDGTPIVLLHSFAFAKESWDGVAAQLRPFARVVRLDLRGLGASRGGPGPYLMEALASDVAGVLDARNIDRAIVVGNGLGAYVTFAFYRMFEERVAALGFAAARAGGDEPAAAAQRNELAERIERDGMKAAVDAMLPRYFAEATYEQRPAVVERVRAAMLGTDPRGAAAVLRGMAARAPSGDLLADMRLPVLVAVCADDRVVPPAEQQQLAAAIPGAGSVTLASGHIAPLDAPDAFAAALAALVREAQAAV